MPLMPNVKYDNNLPTNSEFNKVDVTPPPTSTKTKLYTSNSAMVEVIPNTSPIHIKLKTVDYIWDKLALGQLINWLIDLRNDLKD